MLALPAQFKHNMACTAVLAWSSPRLLPRCEAKPSAKPYTLCDGSNSQGYCEIRKATVIMFIAFPGEIFMSMSLGLYSEKHLVGCVARFPKPYL